MSSQSPCFLAVSIMQNSRLTKMAECYELRGEYDEGLLMLQRALSIDPLQEELYRRVMLIHYRAGNILGVSKTYKKLKTVLDDEIQILPMPETRALYEGIIANRSLEELGLTNQKNRFNYKKPKRELIKDTRLPFPLIGREQELKKLEELSQKNGLILIQGDPGIGKTRLIEEYMEHWDGIIFYGHCLELQTNILPYHPIIEAIRKFVNSSDLQVLENIKKEINPAYWNALRCLIPEINFQDKTLPGTIDDTYCLMEAISQFFIILSKKQKIIMVLDDLHWADNATLGLLGYIIQQCSSEDIVFLGTRRLSNPTPQLNRLLALLKRLNLLSDLCISPLKTESIVLFADQIKNNNSVLLGQWLEQISEGNPYILTELIYYMREESRFSADDTVDVQSVMNVPIIPQTIESFIRARFDSLSEGARRLLDSAAACGISFSFKMISNPIILSESDALDALDELLENGLIRAKDDQEYVFNHSMIREVVYRLINPSRRQWIHLQIAEMIEKNVLVGKESQHAVLAFHFGESSQPERSVPYALRAGDNAAKLAAWTEAISFYEQAYRYSDENTSLSILSYLIEMYVNNWQFSQVELVSPQFADLAQKAGREDMFLLSQMELYIVKNMEEYLWAIIPNFLEPIPAETEKYFFLAQEYCQKNEVDKYFLARLYLIGALSSIYRGNLAEAVVRYKHLLNETNTTDCEGPLLRLILAAKLGVGVYGYYLGKPGAKESIMAGLQLAKEKRVVYFLPAFLCEYGKILTDEGKFQQAQAMFDEGLEQAHICDMPYHIAGIKTAMGSLHLKCNQTEDALKLWKEALRITIKMNTYQLQTQLIFLLFPFSSNEERKKYTEIIESFA